MTVLSLFDGMSGMQIALNRLGIKIDKYFASEIEEIAIKVTKDNYPSTIHIGDVTKITYKRGVLYTENGNFKIDVSNMIVSSGSPCTDLSAAGNREGIMGSCSILFFDFIRILNEIRIDNPNVIFFQENVAKGVNIDDINAITSALEVNPIRINSDLVSAQMRDRLYWSNISTVNNLFGYQDMNIRQPKNKNINLQSILTSGKADRAKARALLESDSRPLKQQEKMIHRYFNTGFTTMVFDNGEYRYLNQTELERCQTAPEGYTKCLTRNQAASVLGNGWTIDVICHILQKLKTCSHTNHNVNKYKQS